MEVWQAALLGLVEGVTEFLPVSSTGHLILTQHVLGIPSSPAVQAFEVCIQSGAIAAVLAVFLGRVRRMALGCVGRDPAGLRLTLQLLVAFVPAGLAALLLGKAIKAHLFGLTPVVIAWFVGGAVILLVPRLRAGADREEGRPLEALDFRSAFLIGCVQCLALWPGTSRSLATLAGALFLGLSGAAAVEFSLLLGFVTLLAATGHDALSEGATMVRELGVTNLLVGFLAAFASAFLAVRWLVARLARSGLAPFGWYRIALAAAVLLWMASGSGPR
ncbi:MAG: undecaprenyl-diphosphate phosphatase [Planctomycetes bacterium]|nr:undecaprenyl-diphosphate phosphatase [Planctomycetota bacterium]